MNIPLNIDIQQILLHLFNFFILAAGLYILLYKPVKDFMDKRDAAIQNMKDQTEEALNEAEKLKASYEEKMAGADAEIIEMREKAEAEARTLSAQKVNEAQEQAQKILSDARENADNEKQKIIDSAKEEIVELASAAADNIVRQSLGIAEGSGNDEG